MAVSAAFAYLAIRGVRLREVWEGLRESDYWWTAPSVALLFVAQALRALRWQYLFAASTRPPYRPVLDATLLGQAFNNLLPARAGEAARVVALHRSARASRDETVATVLVERLFDVLALLALLFVLVPWLPHVTWLGTAAILGAALLVATAAAVVLLARFADRTFRRRIVESFVRGAASLRDWRLAALAVVLTTVSWLVLAASSWVLLYGFDLPHSPLAGMLVTIATGLSLVLPSSPGAVGVFEAAALVALAAYDVPRADALPYALVLHAVNFFPYVGAGALVLVRARLRR